MPELLRRPPYETLVTVLTVTQSLPSPSELRSCSPTHSAAEPQERGVLEMGPRGTGLWASGNSRRKSVQRGFVCC